jgi:hypothetical protein
MGSAVESNGLAAPMETAMVNLLSSLKTFAAFAVLTVVLSGCVVHHRGYGHYQPHYYQPHYSYQRSYAPPPHWGGHDHHRPGHDRGSWRR